MTRLVNVVDESSASMFMEVERLYDALLLLPLGIHAVLVTEYIVGFFLVVAPVVPMLMVIFSTFSIVIVIFMSFYSERADVASRAEAGLKRFGPRGFTSLIIMIAVLGSIDLHAGIVSSRFCLNADANAVGLTENVDYEFFGHNHTETMRSDVVGAARFYVEGAGYNPLEKIVNSIRTSVDTLTDVRNRTSLIQAVAGSVCPQLQKLQAEKYRGRAVRAAKNMEVLLSPKQLWPYYDELVHKILCERVPEQMRFYTLISILTGFCMIPVLAITFHIDLRRMIAYKGDLNFVDEYDEDTEPESEQEYEFVPVYTVEPPRKPKNFLV